MSDGGAWKTPEIRAAETRFDAAVARLRERNRALTQRLERLREQTRPDREELRQVRAAIREGRLGRDGQMLQVRVDRGEFTWEDLAAGRVDDLRAQHLYKKLQEHVAEAFRKNIEEISRQRPRA